MRRNFRGSCAALLLVAATLYAPAGRALPPQPAQATERTPLSRTFTERVESVAIENGAGRIFVRVWDDSRVRVEASRAGAAGGAVDLDSLVRFERVAPAILKIVASARQGTGVNLAVSVPKFASLSVRGADGSVSVEGLPRSLSVETGAGGISLRLPTAAGTDLSARSIEGSISAQIPIIFFGALNAHSLDGKTGQGGVPVILRSASGSIEILPEQNGAARADAKPADDSTGAGVARAPRGFRPADKGGSASVAEDDAPAGAAQTFSDESSHGAATGSAPRGARGESVEDGDVLTVDSRVVNLNVRVADVSGKLVPNLTKADFQVFENNVEQEITSFEPVSAPVSLVLLLDLSTSTKDRMSLLKKAAKKFVESLDPNARVAVGAFTRRFMLVSDFTQDRKLLKKRIDETKNLHSGTAFYDAMWSTLDLFKETTGKRKAVVVLSDGVDNSISSDNFTPRHTFDELIARVAQEDVTIYPIYLDTEFEVTVKMRTGDSHETYVTARSQLQRIAGDAGGTLFKAGSAEDLESVYQRVAAELQTLYSVSYNPKDKDYDGTWRNLAVRVRQPQVSARTRRGYYAK
ncbi:MAG: VWA domain-containing protein [Pyrinomonadaceae bacterium]